MRSALVFLADSTHSRIDRLFAASKQETHTRVFTFVSFFSTEQTEIGCCLYLATVDVLDGRFPEEEVNVVAVGH